MAGREALFQELYSFPDDNRRMMVVYGLTCEKKLSGLYRQQLTHCSIPHTICKQEYNAAFNSIRRSTALFREVADYFRDYERLVLTDGHDMMFFGDYDLLWLKVRDIDGVLFAGDCVFYPYDEKDVKLILDRRSPGIEARYVNGGCLCGSPAALYALANRLDAFSKEEWWQINQAVYNRYIAYDGLGMAIDMAESLFYCCLAADGTCRNDLYYDGDYARNVRTGETPCFIHLQGNIDHHYAEATYRERMASCG